VAPTPVQPTIQYIPVPAPVQPTIQYIPVPAPVQPTIQYVRVLTPVQPSIQYVPVPAPAAVEAAHGPLHTRVLTTPAAAPCTACAEIKRLADIIEHSALMPHAHRQSRCRLSLQRR
jgi:hypothetical protein